MKEKKETFTDNFPQFDLKSKNKDLLNKKLKNVDKELLEFFSTLGNKFLKNKSFLNFILQEVEISSKLLLETNETIKKETDPWKKRDKLQILTNTIINLDSIIHNLKDIALLQFETIELKPQKINITNLITEQISKHVKNSTGPRILPKFPLDSVFFLVDENRFKILIEDILNFSQSLLKNKGTILIEILKSENKLKITTTTNPVKTQINENLSDSDFFDKKSESLNTNISKIFAYRIETIINLLGGSILVSTKSPDSLEINLIFERVN